MVVWCGVLVNIELSMELTPWGRRLWGNNGYSLWVFTLLFSVHMFNGSIGDTTPKPLTTVLRSSWGLTPCLLEAR